MRRGYDLSGLHWQNVTNISGFFCFVFYVDTSVSNVLHFSRQRKKLRKERKEGKKEGVLKEGG